ncbi:hypothetical protein Q4F19_17135 [Sphingomonas sp. BIUV-7]|uniref:Uncharacterized protein n=1 Tax=Sphingomonas natans TaxID=3063330 RepID=A0ABT8YEA4_9SPHN|nr:hypothetical protein [Sphingomonas sp. BIUV-7]MDO6416113.1 hypothetical protein [Sphingomonas sp. BIUV-7]
MSVPTLVAPPSPPTQSKAGIKPDTIEPLPPTAEPRIAMAKPAARAASRRAIEASPALEPDARRRAPAEDARPGDPVPVDTIPTDLNPHFFAPGRSPVELSPRAKSDLPPPVNDAAPPIAVPPPAATSVTIGHVTVEIVDDRHTTSSSVRPLTAASASVIGPLGQARAARRLIALRHL